MNVDVANPDHKAKPRADSAIFSGTSNKPGKLDKEKKVTHAYFVNSTDMQITLLQYSFNHKAIYSKIYYPFNNTSHSSKERGGKPCFSLCSFLIFTEIGVIFTLLFFFAISISC